jgi:hypothetical protein
LLYCICQLLLDFQLIYENKTTSYKKGLLVVVLAMWTRIKQPLIFNVVFSGSTWLEIYCHGDGSFVFIYLYNSLCMWNTQYIYVCSVFTWREQPPKVPFYKMLSYFHISTENLIIIGICNTTIDVKFIHLYAYHLLNKCWEFVVNARSNVLPRFNLWRYLSIHLCINPIYYYFISPDWVIYSRATRKHVIGNILPWWWIVCFYISLQQPVYVEHSVYLCMLHRCTIPDHHWTHTWIRMETVHFDIVLLSVNI